MKNVNVKNVKNAFINWTLIECTFDKFFVLFQMLILKICQYAHIGMQLLSSLCESLRGKLLLGSSYVNRSKMNSCEKKRDANEIR